MSGYLILCLPSMQLPSSSSLKPISNDTMFPGFPSPKNPPLIPGISTYLCTDVSTSSSGCLSVASPLPVARYCTKMCYYCYAAGIFQIEDILIPVLDRLGETEASASTDHVRHLSLTSFHFFFGISGKMTLLHIHQCTSDRNMRIANSKTETLRDENVFFGVESKNKKVFLFQIYKLFTVICQTFIVPKYSVYIIVSDCLWFITVFIILMT